MPTKCGEQDLSPEMALVGPVIGPSVTGQNLKVCRRPATVCRKGDKKPEVGRRSKAPLGAAASSSQKFRVRRPDGIVQPTVLEGGSRPPAGRGPARPAAPHLAALQGRGAARATPEARPNRAADDPEAPGWPDRVHARPGGAALHLPCAGHTDELFQGNCLSTALASQRDSVKRTGKDTLAGVAVPAA